MLTCQGSQRKAIMVPFTASVEHKNFLKFFPDELMLKFIFKNSGVVHHYSAASATISLFHIQYCSW